MLVCVRELFFYSSISEMCRVLSFNSYRFTFFCSLRYVEYDDLVIIRTSRWLLFCICSCFDENKSCTCFLSPRNSYFCCLLLSPYGCYTLTSFNPSSFSSYLDFLFLNISFTLYFITLFLPLSLLLLFFVILFLLSVYHY